MNLVCADISHQWERIKPQIEKIKASGQVSWEPQDILDSCNFGESRLYIGRDDPGSWLILKVMSDRYSGEKYLFVWLAWGKDGFDSARRHIPDVEEIGRDGPFMLNGKTPKKGFWGLEKKAQFYIGRWTEEPPEILAEIERKQEPIYKKLGFAGIFSNEVRVTKKGVAYPMDDCCRAPNPPTSTLLKVYGRSYAQAIYDLAHDRLPILKPEYLYGAEIILSSSWHERHEIHIPKVSEELQEWFLLRNVTKRDNGELYCIENKCGGHFGSIVAVGNSVDEVGELVEDRAKQLKVYRMDYTKNFLEEMRPEIEKAKEYAGADLEAKESKKAA